MLLLVLVLVLVYVDGGVWLWLLNFLMAWVWKKRSNSTLFFYEKKVPVVFSPATTFLCSCVFFGVYMVLLSFFDQ